MSIGIKSLRSVVVKRRNFFQTPHNLRFVWRRQRRTRRLSSEYREKPIPRKSQGDTPIFHSFTASLIARAIIRQIIASIALYRNRDRDRVASFMYMHGSSSGDNATFMETVSVL